MRVLAVGGSGYLGTLVLPYLAVRHELRVFDLRPPADPAWEYAPGDVCDPQALAGAAAGTDALLYMAMGAYVPVPGDDWGTLESRVNAFDVSVKGLHLALHAARGAGVGHAVYTSSMSVYADNGLGRVGADEDTPPDCDQVYGLTKRLGEEVCRSACRAWGMSVNALRLYLPVPEARWQAQAGGGEPTPATTAADTARALLAALEYRDGFQAFTISGDYDQRLLNTAKAKRLLGWEPLARPLDPKASPTEEVATPLGPLTVAKARVADADAVLALLRAASEWLTARGIDQWAPGRFTRAGTVAAIGHGDVYVARRGAVVVATLRLQWADEPVWGARPDDAGYVHALAVGRAYAGHGIGLLLLRWAERRVAAVGRPYLRLGCTADNSAMRDYYRRAGFTCVGQENRCGWEAALFERPVGPAPSARSSPPALP